MVAHVTAGADLPQPNRPGLGSTTPTLSLSGLHDLLIALESEIAAFPVPADLFARELEQCLVEASELIK